jgi:hypothetical protein
MHGKRTPAWWLARFELAIGVGLILLIGVLGWLATRPSFGASDPALGPLALPSMAFVSVAALVVAVVGLILMIRILRGPRDEPPPWRYRDH